MRSARAHLPKPRKTIRDGATAMRRTLVEEGVVVGVRRRAAAEDAELGRAVVLELMPRARRDENRVAGADGAGVAVDLNAAGPFDDEVDLFRRAVVMPLRRLVRLERRLGEALRVRMEQLPDRRAVSRPERFSRG